MRLELLQSDYTTRYDAKENKKNKEKTKKTKETRIRTVWWLREFDLLERTLANMSSSSPSFHCPACTTEVSCCSSSGDINSPRRSANEAPVKMLYWELPLPMLGDPEEQRNAKEGNDIRAILKSGRKKMAEIEGIHAIHIKQ